MSEKSLVRTFLWFDGGLDEALPFYRETFGDVIVHSENRQAPNGPLFTADFSLLGQEFIAMNHPGGPAFNDSISISVQCDGQAETDRLWNAITKEGAPGQCGWCKDKWGLSWQITPIQLRDHVGNPDPKKAEYAWTALRGMTKIVIEDLYE